MSIKETIEKARERGISDDLIVEKILESNPDKRELFQKALGRGTSSTQIIDEIIKQNQGDEQKKKELKNRSSKSKDTKDQWKTQLAKIKQSHFLSDLLDVTHHPIVGIDISDHSIEVMQLNKQERIVAYGRSILRRGIVEHGNILEQKELIDILKETLKNTKPSPLIADESGELKAIVGLPESKTYIQYFSLENKNRLYEKIKEKIEKTIPLPIKDLYWDFLKVENEKKEIKIICVAVRQDVIDSYIYFLRAAGITPIALDIESASVARSLSQITYNSSEKKKNNKKEKEKEKEKKSEDNMILDIGAKTTTITVYNDFGMICFAISIPYAGFLFTEKIAQHLSISQEKAEELKISQGFRQDTEFFSVLEKEALKIVEEIKQAIDFYKKDFGRDVKKIILAGGSALLPEIDNFFQKFFDFKVEIGNPFMKIKKNENLSLEKGILYSNVIGLALRGISENPAESGINLLPTEIKTKETKTYQSKKKSILIASAAVAFSGLILLVFTIYYLIFLPVPHPMQPLKHRVTAMFLIEKLEDGVEIKIKEEFIGEEINVSKAPNQDSEIIFTINQDSDFKLLQKIDVWYKIELDDKTGWIHIDYIDVFEDVIIPEEENVIIPEENVTN